ncbi:glycosyltransferase family 52 [Vibrio breoganii]|uniref:Glycosyltransferase family 52 n=1 Tax=Vibrio breoganii TaxID=553239 RepID=A0ABX1UDR9_9VIBR|nr:glycosyltransferase family 52 [Vibrio breoganii]NMO75054.1 hypothetical protein [Vibrio breoganii]NMR71613.1 hypothetical protein [Vibrio breoganii]OED99210.1 hypothetical protein A1QG_00325 [Vibrio breoganii ZF-29]OEF80999.1 hypothetical protein B003_13560 [Vibrio breoganii 1C10]PML87197.1 hypothetical protein BCT67_12535 [Vibrio breoganii]
MKKTLVFENTYFSLFVFLLYDKNWKSYDYLLWGNRFDHDFVEHFSTYVNVLDASHKAIPRLITKSSKSLVKYYLDKLNLRNIVKEYDTCIGNVRELNDPFISINRVQIDDGVGTTQFELINGPKKSSYFSSLLNIIVLRERIKISKTSKFLLTKNIEVNSDYSRKCAIMDMNEKWAELSESEKKEILSVFRVSFEDFEEINRESAILFTQPFSENRSDYSEIDKINGYKELIASHNISEDKLIIKPHPAEKTNYIKHFPRSTVIRPSFPAELMPLLGVNVDKVLSVATNAGECFKGSCNLIYYSKGAGYFNFPVSLMNKLNSMELESWKK